MSSIYFWGEGWNEELGELSVVLLALDVVSMGRLILL